MVALRHVQLHRSCRVENEMHVPIPILDRGRHDLTPETESPLPDFRPHIPDLETDDGVTALEQK
jgi:hypothetical protein